MASIPTYTGGTGIKAPRIDKGLAGNKAGAWLSLFSGALRMADGFSFIAEQRADRKKAESASASNSWLLTSGNAWSDLYRDAKGANDPAAFERSGGDLAKRQFEDLRNQREEGTISAEDEVRLQGHILTTQARYRKEIDDAWLRSDAERKNEEAELAAAVQLANPAHVGPGFASQQPEEVAIAARQMQEAEAAIMDPQGKWASQGPAAQALAWHDYQRSVSKAAITSDIMRAYAAGADTGKKILDLRQRSGMRDGVYGYAMPNGMRMGNLLDAKALDAIADDVEADIVRMGRSKVAKSGAGADNEEVTKAQAYLAAWREFRGGRISADTFLPVAIREGGLTVSQAVTQVMKGGESSDSQTAFENRMATPLMADVSDLDMAAIRTKDASGHREAMDRVMSWQKAGLVGEDWAEAKVKYIQGRIDRINEEIEGTLSLKSAEEGVMDRVQALVGQRTSTKAGQAAIVADQYRQFGARNPGERVYGLGRDEGFAFGDAARVDDIVASTHGALKAKVPPPTVEFLAGLSVTAGANGDWLRYAKTFGTGDGGVQGAQELWTKDANVAIGVFPHLKANTGLLSFDAGGGIDTKATRQAIRDTATTRAKASRGGWVGRTTLQQQGAEAVPVSQQEVMEALTGPERYVLGFTLSLDAFLAYDAPLAPKVELGRINMEMARMKAERDLAEATP